MHEVTSYAEVELIRYAQEVRLEVERRAHQAVREAHAREGAVWAALLRDRGEEVPERATIAIQDREGGGYLLELRAPPAPTE